MATPVVGYLAGVPRNQGVPVPNFIPLPTWVDTVALSAATAKNYVVPTRGVMMCVRSNTYPVYVNPNGAAVASVGDHVDGSGSSLIERERFMVCQAGQTLSFISTPGAVLTIDVWS